MKTNMKGWVTVVFLLVVLVGGALHSASAAIINVEGSQYGEDVSAVLDFVYTPISKKQGELRLNIHNTSNSDFAIKAFYVKLPEGIQRARFKNNPGWKGLFHSDPCFYAGLFDFLGYSYTKPIEQGESGEFSIRLKGKNLGSLYEGHFVDLLKDDGLAFYFKGKDSFNQYRSDVGIPVSDGAPVPIPSAVFLLGSALTMIGALHLARRKEKICCER